jgi:hypothetical protein
MSVARHNLPLQAQGNAVRQRTFPAYPAKLDTHHQDKSNPAKLRASASQMSVPSPLTPPEIVPDDQPSGHDHEQAERNEQASRGSVAHLKATSSALLRSLSEPFVVFSTPKHLLFGVFVLHARGEVVQFGRAPAPVLRVMDGRG